MEIWEKFDKKIDTKGLKDDIKAAKENKGGGEYEEVPHGKYEVRVEKLELKESKKGDPMVSIWFKIIAGKFKNSIIFYNQVITQGFQIHLNNQFLESLDTGVNIEFDSYKQYNEVLMDVAEGSQNLEYVLEYGENKKGYSTFKILEVFEAE
jgi:predicted phage tail protein